VLRARLASAAAILALGPILLHGQQAPQTPAPTPTFRTSATGVQISVVITDERGEPVAGLTQDDFEIVERGEPRSITTFSAIDIPMERADPEDDERDVLTNDRPPGRLYVIALDDMMPDAALRSRQFLRDFIERYFGPNDQAAIVLTTQGPADSGQEFTGNRRLLLNAIDRFSGGTTTGEWNREKNFMSTFKELTRVMATLQAPRKSLILVSSGIPGDPNLLPRARTTRIGRMFSDVNPDFYDAVAMATRNSISIYPIDPYGLTTTSTAPESFDTAALDDRTGLAMLARMTGGFALTGSNNYDGAFVRLVRENSVYYTLGFNSDDQDKGGYARVEVRVRRPGLRVQTIEGYLGGKTPEVKRPKTVMAAAWDAVASPMTTSGVQMRMFAAPYRTDGKVATVVITLEIATNRINLVERDGAYRGDLEILFAVTDSKGKKRFRVMRHRAIFALKPETYQRVSERALRVVSELPLPEGRYQLRASAGVDTIAGSVVYDVEVPDFRDDFSLSGVALTSNRARETFTVSPPGSTVVVFPGPPTTAREFSRDDVVTLFAEAYENRKKRHQVQLAMELRDATGRVLDRLEMERTSPEKPKEPGIYVFSPSLSLAEVPPGSYVISVEAKSSLEKKAILRTVPITVR
jgi:VWFA-related protein